MSKLRRSCGVIIILICLLAVGSGHSAQAQVSPSFKYFPDTGHTVSGEMWGYYQSVPNASLVFGSPITEQFNEADGLSVQYFQRARLEFHPENPTGERVIISALGPPVYAHTPVHGGVSAAPIGCRFYAETGFSLCYDFLKFFDKNGGEAIFGKPISSFVFYNDRIVQYFEGARFDWYPEYPEGQKVVLAQLGRIYFDLANEDPNRLRPLQADNTPNEVTAIRAHAFTWKALTQASDEQAVYVVVQDQTLKPVSGATTVITISWAQGGQQSIAVSSNASGVVILPLQVKGQERGSVILVQAEVLYQGMSAKTTTSFRIWQ